MRIALITDGIAPYVLGGMQKHSYYLAKYFAKNKVYVDLVHYNDSNYNIVDLEFFSEEEKKYINSIVLQFPSSPKFPGHYVYKSYKYSCLAFNAIKENLSNYDFIYTKGFSGWKLISEKRKGTISCCKIGIKFHGYEMFQPAPSFKSKIEQILLFRGPVKFICHHADFVFSYGSKINDVIKSIPIPSSKIVAIPTGIEAEWLNNQIKPTDNIKKFLFIGRYERRKGIQELSSALSNLKVKNAEFHFIGPIPEQNKVIKDNIIYHGAIHNQEEIKKITRNCDILLCPSYSEGMPNVIMEGMASGLAIIASNVGAVNLLVDKNNGYLLELKELNNLHQIIDDFSSKSANEINDMKSYSMNKIKDNFLWTHIAQLHLDFFVSSLKK